jgi:hypothetical protein
MLNAEELNARLPDYWEAFMSDEDILVAVCDEVTFQIVDNKLEYPKTLEQIREEFGDVNRADLIIFEMNYRKVERIIEGFLGRRRIVPNRA